MLFFGDLILVCRFTFLSANYYIFLLRITVCFFERRASVNTEKSLCELNYAWLNLVQKMLLKDRGASQVRLGIGTDIATVLAGLTEKELRKLSVHPHFIFSLRIKSPEALKCLLHESRVDHLQPAHAAILCLSE